MRKTTWALLLGVWLSGCMASLPVVPREPADTLAVEQEGQEADLAFLCDEQLCGFYRRQEGARDAGPGDASPGSIVRTRGTTPSAVRFSPPGHAGSPSRSWGRPVSPLEREEAVFLIPWRNHHLRHLLPSQRKLIEEADKRLNRPHEKHHLFSQEFKAWFERKGIDIHQWTMLIETDRHRDIHRGPSGGAWNAAWRQFIQESGSTATREEIWKYAGELCVRFGLMAPLLPYRAVTPLPPPIAF